jgi:hypothetical protein
MTILFDATRIAKPARHFGAGLLTYVPPSRRVGHTASDEAAYAQLLADESVCHTVANRQRATANHPCTVANHHDEAADREAAAREFDRAIEDRYIRSYQLDRVCSGPLF